MTRRKIWLGVLVAAIALAAEAAPVLAQKTPIKLGVSGRPDQAALELALRRGYFEQEGLDVQTVQGTTGQEMLPALATNQLQAASGSPNAGLFNALNRGIEVRMVADFAHIGPSDDRSVSFVVRADLIDSGQVKTIADMKGRPISWGPGQGQITELFLAKVLARGKLTKADVEPRYLTFADSLSAMGNKSLDGAFMVEPLVTMGDRQNIARVMMRGSEVDPGAELSLVYFSPAFAQNRDAATKFMVAFLKGVRDYYDAFFLNKGKAEAIALLIQHLPIKDAALWEASRQYGDLNGRINVASVKEQAEFYHKLGLVSGGVPNIDKFIDTSFAEAAVQRLGARSRN
jgi:NitT/TauT family transport system substrate-binding protein